MAKRLWAQIDRPNLLIKIPATVEGLPAITQVLAAGISGGFASVFGTPAAGFVFGLEVPSAGRIRHDGALPCLVAALVGDLTTRAWGVGHSHYPRLPDIGLEPLLLAKVALASVAFGLAALLFVRLTDVIRHQFRTRVAWAPLRPALGGAVVIVEGQRGLGRDRDEAGRGANVFGPTRAAVAQVIENECRARRDQCDDRGQQGIPEGFGENLAVEFVLEKLGEIFQGKVGLHANARHLGIEAILNHGG